MDDSGLSVSRSGQLGEWMTVVTESVAVVNKVDRWQWSQCQSQWSIRWMDGSGHRVSHSGHLGGWMAVVTESVSMVI